jgi:hypothetical protein
MKASECGSYINANDRGFLRFCSTLRCRLKSISLIIWKKGKGGSEGLFRVSASKVYSLAMYNLAFYPK